MTRLGSKLLVPNATQNLATRSQDWVAYNQERGLPQSELDAAQGRKGIGYVQAHVDAIQATLEGSNIDFMDVLAVSGGGVEHGETSACSKYLLV